MTGPYESPSGASVVTTGFSDLLTFTPQNHTLKFGGGASKNGGNKIVGANYFGLFGFAGNLTFNPADLTTYPNRFQIRLGELFSAWMTGARTYSSRTSGRPRAS